MDNDALIPAARAAVALTGTVAEQRQYLRGAGWGLTADTLGWRDPQTGGTLLLRQAVDKQAKRDVEAAKKLLIGQAAPA